MDDLTRFGIISYIIRKLEESRQYFGKVVIQKIFYFLTSYSKVPLPYEFYFYHFGPYSDLLKHDLEMMQLFGMIKIKEDPKSMGNEIIPGEEDQLPGGDNEAQSVVKQYSGPIDRVLSSFGSKDPAELELLATIHYVFEKTKPVYENTEEHRQVVLQKVKQLKPKFPLASIENAYVLLDGQGFLTR